MLLSTNSLKGGTHATTPEGRSFRTNLKGILEKEWPWVAHTNCFQQKQVKIQQKPGNYDKD